MIENLLLNEIEMVKFYSCGFANWIGAHSIEWRSIYRSLSLWCLSIWLNNMDVIIQ